MQITYFKLHKMKSLGLSNVNTFEWSPKQSLLVILGANGSGKSMIMSELTPVPARHNKFFKDGIKEIRVLHNGSEYHLTSVYSGGTGKHSFIKDSDVELNPGGTFKIQEELVLEEFGLTREIHDIATGRLKFTDMSTAKRRELLTKMSPVDLSYAFDIYNKVRSEHRSQKGVIDLLTKRLVNENHDIPSDNEISLLRERSKDLSARLTDLFEKRVVTHDKPFNSSEEAAGELKRVLEQTHRILNQHVDIPNYVKVKDYESFNNYLTGLNNVVQNNNNLINRLAEELDKLKKLDDQDFESMELELESLQKTNSELVKTISERHAIIKGYNGMFPLEFENLDSIGDLNTLEGIFKQWHELLVSFPINEDRYFGRDVARDRQELLRQRRAELQQWEANLIQVRTRIKSIKECAAIECPQCEHSFKPGVNPNDVQGLLDDESKIPDQIARLEGLIAEDQEYLEAFEDYYSFVLRYSRLTKEYPRYQKLWDYCTENQIMFVNPSQFVTQAMEWYNATKAGIEFNIKSAQKAHNDKRIQNLSELDRETLDYVNRRKTEIHSEIDGLYQQNNETNLKIQKLGVVRSVVTERISQIDQVLKQYQQWVNNATKYRDYLLMQGYNTEIHELQLQLAETSKELSSLEQRETSIRTLENEVSNASVAYTDLGLLNRAMSPSGGLIGRYLLTFMQGVTGLVNAYINEVWSHSLEVLPSKVDKDELDYNFPIYVADGAIVTNDISEGSESQLDIINFAFMLTILKLLKVQDMPLYLDEFGRTFDEQHKANLIPFITNLIDNGLFKQIFFVSHLAGIHGAFNLAEFAVINNDNITVPDVYNQNVIIK